MDIPPTHSKMSPELVVYLGFPIMTSSTQRNYYFTASLNNLKTVLITHSRKNISLLGRATMANSLILSKCWCFFRVTPFPLSVIQKIRALISGFVNNVFPKLKREILAAPKKSGGLNILDPGMQQKPLGFRWVEPILFKRRETAKVYQYVVLHLQNVLKSDNLNIPFLFPAARRSLFCPLTSVQMILRAVDLMPRSFHNSEPNPLECLMLPLPAILGSRKIGPFKLSTKLRNAQVSELFRYHPDGHFLSRKPLTDVSTPLRLVANKFFRAMDRNHVAIQDFFYNCFFQTASSLSNPDHCMHIRTQQLGFLSFKKS
ncbi:hypothetical protein BY458DRAFT_582703 [Sporodiniella umbellata]|nr:hypothetical protein BY458DRAFT_582703 [Sporodiniella umbellata]